MSPQNSFHAFARLKLKESRKQTLALTWPSIVEVSCIMCLLLEVKQCIRISTWPFYSIYTTAVQKKQMPLWQQDSWLLHYDNTHIKHNTSDSYSPDLSPAVLFLFLNLKVRLKGYQFGLANKTHLKKNATAGNQFLKNRIHNDGKKWRYHCNRCINAGGNNF